MPRKKISGFAHSAWATEVPWAGSSSDETRAMTHLLVSAYVLGRRYWHDRFTFGSGLPPGMSIRGVFFSLAKSSSNVARIFL